jgi:GNAT superfamily N-acetyltransferase
LTSPTPHSSAPVVVEQARGLFGRLAFLGAAAALRSEPQFTPDLSIDFLRITSPRNPFFRHAELALFVARRGGKIAGRVAACIDSDAARAYGARLLHFGFFEAADGDLDTTRALLDRCADYGRVRRQEILRGPVDLSTNFRVGLLVEGNAEMPSIMMPWNPAGHAALLEASGLRKVKDVLAMEVDAEHLTAERYGRIAARILDKGGYTVRSFDLRRFDAELERARAIYNAAWAENWGFVPMSSDEFRYQGHGMKEVADPNLCVFIEKAGAPVGFAIAIPDMAIAIREVKGKLLPLGWLHLLRRAKTLDRMRILLLGVLPEHRKHGLDAVLYHEMIARGLRRGVRSAEFGWLLEDNDEIIRGCQASGARISRRCRIYERPL